ncbi:lactonase family protein [Stackebrandtia nassauensis]|uniref:3-carboxymuconate cyclase n=1 Tax=Stackebrandtia nassauensis (strain DSM 44728 / CIP 108903 / NRRL B-16338 / NBRC 102104 / LLR-40K-21) TaxID=446470 RepID=D3Q756_STANL|nr:lactonase family protein [Stackebrandtia nassauensis]ADD42327.1 3-carboxymuconate cyclase [Stackebrandtia nassauensis DSM 44728]
MRLILGSHTAVGVADTATGAVTARRELLQPTFVAAASDRSWLYAVSEDPDGPGKLLALRHNGSDLDGEIVARLSGDTGPCHVSLHPDGRHALVSHYTGGSLGVVPLAADGTPGIGASVVRHSGTGPDPQRQEGPHAHQAVTDPSGQWIVACDLGADEVVVYRLDEYRLRRHSVAAFPPGHGVRHLAFAPDARHAYVAAELSSQLVMCDWDSGSGVLSPGKSIDTSHGRVRNYPGAVLVSPDGANVYVTNRGEDSIAVVDTADFTLRETVDCGGIWPRDACLSPDGQRLYVANERSGTVTGFDLDDGIPVPSGPVIGFDGVTSVLALSD